MTASCLALAALALGGVAVASGEDGGATTLTITQRAPDVAAVDLSSSGPSPGDVLVFRSALFDETNARRVGSLHITCAQSFGVRHICRGIFVLAGRGKLSVDALPEFPLPATGIVNGGTKEFERARGEAHIKPQPDGTTLIRFHLFD
jgi:hypothetical protein